MQYTEEQIKEAIIFYLVHNHKDLLKRLSPIVQHRESLLQKEDQSFHDDIKNDFYVVVKREITEELAHELQLDIESIMIAMEEFDIKEFLGE